jgi:transposase
MEVVTPACAGLDVHKKSVVACCLTPGPTGELVRQVRTFGTMTADLLALGDWLAARGVTSVALESTGEFWKPVYNLLEDRFTLLVVNAHHLQHVPGRKTDVKDAEWLAELLRHGLVRASFIPPLPQRDLRDLTRQRTTLVRERAAVVQRLQKVLEWANLKLAAVASDVSGQSGRAMLEQIVAGEADPALLAELARGRLRAKRAALEQALTGRVRDHHRFLIAGHLTHLDFLDEQIARFEAQIASLIEATIVAPPPSAEPVAPAPVAPAADLAAHALADAPPSGAAALPLSWAAAVEVLDTIPGVARTTAEVLVAEIGTDMRRFASPGHLASWVKVAPGNNESAGKRRSAGIGHGNRWLRATLVQAAHAAVKVKDSFLQGFYRRLASRRGSKRAMVAVAHKLVRIIYWLLSTGEGYRAGSTAALDERQRATLAARMQRRLERLGYAVHLEPVAAVA